MTVPCALSHLEIVEANMHLAHPLSEGGPQYLCCPGGLFHGALFTPCAVSETTVGLVPPSEPLPGVPMDSAQDDP